MKKAQDNSAFAERSYAVQALVRALNILEALAEGGKSAYTLTQLSRQLHFPVSTVHRLIANLVRQGFVEEAPKAHRFRLTFKVLRMGLQVLDRLDFRVTARPLLQALSHKTQETVRLAILQGTRAIFIERFDSPQPAGLDAPFGGVMPLHCTGVGKILLAYQGRAFLNQVARAPGLPRFTRRTITRSAPLRKELEKIREQGYALDQEEAVAGLRCVAGPVFDQTGRVVAAFSVTGPSSRLTPERLPEIASLVRATSREISFRLGYRGQMGR